MGFIMKKTRKKRKKSTNRLGIIAITLVVAMLSIVLTIQTINLREKNQTLNAKKVTLQETLDIQNQRKEDLEQQRIYVQTDKYIEQKAKDLGYVYPNEIIFKPRK